MESFQAVDQIDMTVHIRLISKRLSVQIESLSILAFIGLSSLLNLTKVKVAHYEFR